MGSQNAVGGWPKRDDRLLSEKLECLRMKMTDLSQCLETVQVSSPKESFGSLRKEILEAIRDCLDGGRYILGEQVANFERDFASFVGVDFAIGVANGTDALRIALWAAGVGEDD